MKTCYERIKISKCITYVFFLKSKRCCKQLRKMRCHRSSSKNILILTSLYINCFDVCLILLVLCVFNQTFANIRDMKNVLIIESLERALINTHRIGRKGEKNAYIYVLFITQYFYFIFSFVLPTHFSSQHYLQQFFLIYIFIVITNIIQRNVLYLKSLSRVSVREARKKLWKQKIIIIIKTK